MTRASVLIPTHDHHTTLPLTVDSVLRQSVGDLEVLVIGDGVTPQLRAVVEGLAAADPRVRFLDLPKGPHHGEVHRHEAVLAADSDAILYLCDDDLFFPEHVADLLALLEDHDLVQSFNGYVDTAGRVAFNAGDLADPWLVDLLLDERLRYNVASITGTGHSRAFYLEVGDPWQTTPPDQWPDHHQWRKLLRHPGCRAATSARMTTIQLPTHDGRAEWTAQERYDELLGWHALVTAPDGQARFDVLVAEAARRVLGRQAGELRVLQEALAERDTSVHERDLALEHAAGRIEALETELEAAREQAQVADAAHRAVVERLEPLLARAERREARFAERLEHKNAELARLRAQLRASRASPGPAGADQRR